MKTLKSAITILSLAILLGCAENQSKQEVYDVILMGGQSNMVGLAKQDTTQKWSFPNITYHDFGFRFNLINPDDNLGPEVGLATELNKHFPDRKFILIKYAIGGASLLDWAPNYSKEKAEITGNARFGNMYSRLLTLADSLTNEKEVRFSALLWMQGERDARIPEAGVEYYQNFEALINAVRSDFGSSEMPVLFGKINPPAARYPALDTVVSAQIRISEEVPNAHLISTEGLKKLNDNLHYSSEGQTELGLRFGQKLVELLNE